MWRRVWGIKGAFIFTKDKLLFLYSLDDDKHMRCDAFKSIYSADVVALLKTRILLTTYVRYNILEDKYI